MKNTREKILLTLLAFPESTINDLAIAAGINGISVRHHLAALEADSLVTSSEERHGVGRPRLVYSLTDKGVEKFPTSYLLLTKRLLSILKIRYSIDEIIETFKSIGLTIAQDSKPKYHGENFEKRLKILLNLLEDEGFLIQTEKSEEGVWLSSLNCPFYKIGLDHPEVCFIDQSLISEVLSAKVEKQSCIIQGDDRCTYWIPIPDKEVRNDQ
jgi:predicted ArsR family transcriptional regulator